MSFASLGLSAPLLKAIEKQGYNTPTPIQQQAIPAILSGRDIVATAQTGTGKTASFALPLLERLNTERKRRAKRFRALILVPTRELAIQIEDNISQYGKHLSLRSMLMVGGVDTEKQKQTLIWGIDILVATPGRLLDMAHQRALHFDELQMLVLDEADRMLDMGFITDINKIIERLPEQRQNLLFSATLSKDVSAIKDIILDEPKVIEIKEKEVDLSLIEQSAYFVEQEKKGPLLRQLVEESDWNQVLIFTSSIYQADHVSDKLKKNGISARAIHSKKGQKNRQDAIAKFKSGNLKVLVATDLLARGIDIKSLSAVINYELPRSPKDFVHRIGRTGRAEEKGKTILFFTKEERPYKDAIENLMQLKIKQIPFPSEVEHSAELTPEERPDEGELKNYNRNTKNLERGASFHEKSEKNSKVNLGGSYKRKIKTKFKKPKTRGDKNVNRGKKRR